MTEAGPAQRRRSAFLQRLRARPVAAAAVVVLILLYGAMLFAEFLAPYEPTTTFRFHTHHRPSIDWYSTELGFGPQVQRRALVDDVTRRYARIRGEHYRVRLLVRGPEYRLLGLLPMRVHLFGTVAPYVDDEGGGDLWRNGRQAYPVFVLGSDHLGRDILSRILYGSRISLTVGFIAISISLTLAIVLGGLAGYYGGATDWIIMRISEFFILIPGLYMILFLRSVLSYKMDSGQSFVIITLILAFVGWPGTARLIRGMVLSIKTEDFVAAARLQGIPPLVIVVRQIIPQMASILIVSVALGIPGFILAETALSYLALGISDPAVSWGSMLDRNVTSLGNLRSFPWFLYPGLALLITTLSFSFLGDLLRDLLDPYHREPARG
jgi:peptide/nickel transport system permease protein